jgi:alkylhydroperoxidase family enzyme
MAERFEPAEIVELSLAIALFLRMSKVLISLGMEPDAMTTTLLPTPALAHT